MSITRLLRIFGINLNKLIFGWIVLPQYFIQLLKFRALRKSTSSKMPFGKYRPEPYDRYKSGGTAKGHYFHQDLFVAQQIFTHNPDKHVDVGSRVDGFVAHVATFRTIEVLDIRATSSSARNIQFKQADITDLDSNFYNYTDSLSCLHALEHIGLGRYGDKLDFDGHLKGLENLHKMLISGGTLYLSTPIGPQRIEFNSQRVFSVDYLLELTKDKFSLENISYINDDGDIVVNPEQTQENFVSSFGCNYGCGILELKKI